MSKCRVLTACFTLVLVLCLFASAGAAVNLSLLPAMQTGYMGHPMLFNLYAFSDSSENQPISAIDVILNWDPVYLGGLTEGDLPAVWGEDGVGGFFLDAPDNINYSDSNAMYSLSAGPGETVLASPTGTLCATFAFNPLSLTPGSVVSLLSSYGLSATTNVFSGVTPGESVTGSLTGASFRIVPEPTGLVAFAAGLTSLVGLIRRRRA